MFDVLKFRPKKFFKNLVQGVKFLQTRPIYITSKETYQITKRLSPRKTRGPESKVGILAARMRF